MLLSDDDQLRRRRGFVVNIKMTVISWALEFLAGAIILAIMAMYGYGISLGLGMLLPDVCVSFILIPASYLFNNKVNKSLIAVEGWRRGINRAIFSHLPYEIKPSMELQPLPPKHLSSPDNITAHAENCTTGNNAEKRKSFSGCITKEFDLNLEKIKRVPARKQADLSDFPRIQSPPKVDTAKFQQIESDDDIETISSDYVTVAEMLNPDLISTMPENNWI